MKARARWSTPGGGGGRDEKGCVCDSQEGARTDATIRDQARTGEKRVMGEGREGETRSGRTDLARAQSNGRRRRTEGGEKASTGVVQTEEARTGREADERKARRGRRWGVGDVRAFHCAGEHGQLQPSETRKQRARKQHVQYERKRKGEGGEAPLKRRVAGGGEGTAAGQARRPSARPAGSVHARSSLSARTTFIELESGSECG